MLVRRRDHLDYFRSGTEHGCTCHDRVVGTRDVDRYGHVVDAAPDAHHGPTYVVDAIGHGRIHDGTTGRR